MDSAETKDVIMQKIMKQSLSKQGVNSASRKITFQEVIPFNIYCIGAFFQFLRSESDVIASFVVLVIFATATLRCFVILKDLM